MLYGLRNRILYNLRPNTANRHKRPNFYAIFSRPY